MKRREFIGTLAGGITMLFGAVHESLDGTIAKCRDVAIPPLSGDK
jgi:hypothetical protein